MTKYVLIAHTLVEVISFEFKCCLPLSIRKVISSCSITSLSSFTSKSFSNVNSVISMIDKVFSYSKFTIFLYKLNNITPNHTDAFHVYAFSSILIGL